MGIANHFPVFEPDQVLTNTHLNELFHYLDGQSRLSRCKLIGSGIVCGLEITYDDKAIKISKGCALTSQGFLVMLCEDSYTHYVSYTAPVLPKNLQFIRQCGNAATDNIPFYNYKAEAGLLQLIALHVEETPPEGSIALSQVPKSQLDEYAIVLFLEAEELNLKNCDTNDCNDKGSRIDFEVKALLVKKALLDSIPEIPERPFNQQGLPLIELKRYHVPQVRNIGTATGILEAFSDQADDNTLQRLGETLKICYEHYSVLVKDEIENPFVDIGNKLKSKRNTILNQAPMLIQYFYDHLDDLIKAYHEFRKKIFDLNSECCMDEMRFPLHIKLGEATVNTVTGYGSVYRQYFIYSPLFNSQKQRLDEIRFLFTRIKLLIRQFFPDSLVVFDERQIKITPSRFGHAYLSDRCIPYYYKLAEPNAELYQYWNYEKSSKGLAKSNLGYNSGEYAETNNTQVTNPLLFDIERYNFFRIEGHIGKPVLTALTEVKKIKQDFNLPFDLIALSSDFVATILKGEEPQCVIQDLEADYRLLIVEYICKLHDAFCRVYKFEFKPKTVMIKNVISASPPTGAITVKPPLDLTEEEDEELTGLLGKNDFKGFKPTHSALVNFVNEFHTTKEYSKGTSLQRLCGLKQNSIGDIYSSNIFARRGAFENPMSLGGHFKAASLYHRFFELIDSIESMFQILLTSELSELNIDDFRNAYARYESIVKDLTTPLNKINSKVSIFLSTCMVEKLETLISEYNRRIAQYRLAKNFRHYFKMHGGVEHKAGVPRGGTFILVYYEETKNRLIDFNAFFGHEKLGKLILSNIPHFTGQVARKEDFTTTANQLKQIVASSDPEQLLQLKGIWEKFIDLDNEIPAPTKRLLKSALKPPPEKKKFPLRNGMVIADFYVPYICCSDCPPIVYILPEQGDKAIFDIQPKTFLFDDAHNYPFTTNPPVTQANTEQKSFSSAELDNPGNKLKLWTDENNILYLHPAIDKLKKTFETTLTYKNIPLTITIVRPDASFNVEISSNQSGIFVKLEAENKDAKYQWVINNKADLFTNIASPLPRKLEELIQETHSTSLAIELTVTYELNENISSDTKIARLSEAQIKSKINKGPFKPKLETT
jgi:hypothetical protein